MSKKPERLFLAKTLQKLAGKIGAKVLLEPEWKIAGQIVFKNGKHSYFRYNTLDLNPVGASDIAKDKDYANFFMHRMGYKTIPGKTFFADDWCEAIGSKRDADAAARYAHWRYPLIVKPNSGAQGSDVHLVHNERELRSALKKIFVRDRVALLQQYVSGRDFRIVVLDRDIISAYERVPLNVVGDGRSTIRQLLQKKARDFKKTSRDTKIKFDEPRMLAKLRRQKRSLTSILPRGEQIMLLDNANLSTGGDAVDVTKHVHPKWKRLAVALTRDMGLRLCGVDVMIDGDLATAPRNYFILEINAAPGLDHYVKGGREQEKIVENLYLKVLKHLAS